MNVDWSCHCCSLAHCCSTAVLPLLTSWWLAHTVICSKKELLESWMHVGDDSCYCTLKAWSRSPRRAGRVRVDFMGNSRRWWVMLTIEIRSPHIPVANGGAHVSWSLAFAPNLWTNWCWRLGSAWNCQCGCGRWFWRRRRRGSCLQPNWRICRK